MSGRSASVSFVSWRSGEAAAAAAVLEAVLSLAPYVILPSSFYLKPSHVGANSLASTVTQEPSLSRW